MSYILAIDPGNEKSAECDIVCALPLGLKRLFQFVVAGHPDYFPFSQLLPGLGYGDILPSQMHSIGTERSGQVGIIIDNEWRACLAAQIRQKRGLLDAQRRVRCLVAILDQFRAPFQGLAGHAKKCRCIRYIRGDGI